MCILHKHLQTPSPSRISLNFLTEWILLMHRTSLTCKSFNSLGVHWIFFLVSVILYCIEICISISIELSLFWAWCTGYIKMNRLKMCFSAEEKYIESMFLNSPSTWIFVSGIAALDLFIGRLLVWQRIYLSFPQSHANFG